MISFFNNIHVYISYILYILYIYHIYIYDIYISLSPNFTFISTSNKVKQCLVMPLQSDFDAVGYFHKYIYVKYGKY